VRRSERRPPWQRPPKGSAILLGDEPDEPDADAPSEVAERLPVGAHWAGVVGVLPLADVVVDVLDEGAEPDVEWKHGHPGICEDVMTNGPFFDSTFEPRPSYPFELRGSRAKRVQVKAMVQVGRVGLDPTTDGL
jgi:hypothetical protein